MQVRLVVTNVWSLHDIGPQPLTGSNTNNKLLNTARALNPQFIDIITLLGLDPAIHKYNARASNPQLSTIMQGPQTRIMQGPQTRNCLL